MRRACHIGRRGRRAGVCRAAAGPAPCRRRAGERAPRAQFSRPAWRQRLHSVSRAQTAAPAAAANRHARCADWCEQVRAGSPRRRVWTTESVRSGGCETRRARTPPRPRMRRPATLVMIRLNECRPPPSTSPVIDGISEIHGRPRNAKPLTRTSVPRAPGSEAADPSQVGAGMDRPRRSRDARMTSAAADSSRIEQKHA